MKTLKLLTAGMLMYSGISVAQVDSVKVSSEAPATTQTVYIAQPAQPTPTVVETQTVAETPKHDHYVRGIIGAHYMPTFSRFDVVNSSGGVVQGDVAVNHGFGAVLGVTGKYLGAQLEVIYNSLSQKYKENNVERKVDLNYVNVPLLLVLSTDRSRWVNLNIAAGPQVGINVGANVTTTGTDRNGAETAQATVAVKRGDFGVAYGAGLEFALDPAKVIRLSVGFRGVYGLIDISDHSKTMANNQYLVLDRTNIMSYAGYAGLSIFF